MLDDVLGTVERVHDEVDACRDTDWAVLGERIRKTILDAEAHSGADFTDAQKDAIIAVCRETYYAASVIARAYAFKTAEVLRHHEFE